MSDLGHNPVQDRPVEEFEALYELHALLGEQTELGSSEVQPLIDEGISRAEEAMLEMAGRHDVLVHYLGEPAVRALQILKRVEEPLELVGMTDDVEPNRKEVAEHVVTNDSSLTRYLMRIAGLAYVQKDDATTPLTVTEYPATKQIGPRVKHPEVKLRPEGPRKILIDEDDNMMIGDTIISLSRPMKSAGERIRDIEGIAFRVDAIKFLVQNPGPHTQREVFEAVRGNIDYEPYFMDANFKDFFRGPMAPIYENEPLVHVDDSNPQLFQYEIPGDQFKIVETKKPLDIAKNEMIYRVKNGSIAGASSLLILLMTRADGKPISIDDAVASELVNPDAFMTDGKLDRNKFTKAANHARAFLNRHGSEDKIVTVYPDDPVPKAGKKLASYAIRTRFNQDDGI